MIIRTLVGTTLFAFAMIWFGLVLSERDKCKQIEAGTAPIRWVMKGLRLADSNLEVVADRITWLSWSYRADQMAQKTLVKVFHGEKLRCASTEPNLPKTKIQTNTEFEQLGINPFM